MALKVGYLLQITAKSWGRVVGESNFPGHQGWIEVTSFSIGRGDPKSGLEFTFTLPVGKHSMALTHITLVGDFVQGKFDSVYPYGPASTMLEFKNGILSQQIAGGPRGDEPQASLKLVVAKDDGKVNFSGRMLGPPTWTVRP